MPWADAAGIDLILLWTAVGAAALAGIFLGLEFYAAPLWARRAPGAIALILAAASLLVWCLSRSPSVAVGCGILAGLYLVAWPMSLEAVRQRLNRLLTPKVLWGLMLGISLLASRYLATHLLAALDHIPASEEVEFRDVPVREVSAVTDSGRAIPLFHFEMFTPAKDAEQLILAAEKFQHQVIRVEQPSAECNCHGWIFTGGQFGIRNPDVRAILADNGYVAVKDVREADLAIYTNGDDYTHSGVVRLTDPSGLILVESKWGPFGVFLHAPDMQPFSGVCTFYRSARHGHQLALHPVSSADGHETTSAVTSDRL
jgi:hypothetical protein